MNRAFTEGGLRFEFGDSWIVEKYDDHPDYRQRIAKLQTSKAVDFVGIVNDRLHFIEVKDFRGHDADHKGRIESGRLAEEVGLKVRDSISGILGAFRTSTVPQTWAPFVAVLAERSRSVAVVLWLEEDRATESHVESQRRKARAATLAAKLKRDCTTRAFVANTAKSESPLPELQVRRNP